MWMEIPQFPERCARLVAIGNPTVKDGGTIKGGKCVEMVAGGDAEVSFFLFFVFCFLNA